MFESAVLLVAPDQRRRNILVVPLAVALHVLLLGTVLAVRVLAVEELAPPQEHIYAVSLPGLPPPQGPPAPPAGAQQRPSRRDPVTQPAAVPDAVPAPPERAESPAATGVPYGLEPEDGAAPGTRFGGDGDGAASAPPAAAGPPEPPAIYEIRGEVMPPVAVARARPVYPPAARLAGRQGAVRVRAVVGADGSVGAAEVVEDGVGFGCAEAAIAAIRRWRFRPATLGGQPVSVYMEITVAFTLARP